ncbi:Bardet-Biedl syndrome 4 protein-like [Sycon ciliatum]|uniref:Bardet-Biedl syndrome 4 protein-like n=1 Tax=Sycon ciliatum TaxID=27933 RepID=UPI0031F62692
MAAAGTGPPAVASQTNEGASVVRAGTTARKAAEVPIFQKRNWLLYQHYVRQQFKACWDLIKVIKEETKAQSWYAQYVEAMLFRSEGKVQQSLEAFRKASQLDPKSAETKKQIGVSLFLLGRHQLALDAYAAAESLVSRDWEIYHNRALCHLYLQQPDEARELFLKAIQYNQALVTFKQLGRLYEDQKDTAKATETYERGLQLYPNNPEILTRLGMIYLEEGQHTLAFDMLGTAVMFGGKGATSAMLACGSIMHAMGDVEPAMNKYSRIGEVAPESPQLWNNVGLCFFNQEKWPLSIGCLTRANYLAPMDWKIAYNLGLVHLTMQHDTTAFHCLKSAVRLNSSSSETLMLLAICMVRLNEFSNAEICYEKCTTTSTNYLAFLNYATFLARQRRKEDSEKQLNSFYECCEKLGQQRCMLTESSLNACQTLAKLLGVSKTAPQFRVKRRDKKAAAAASTEDRSRRTSGQPV